MACFSEEKRPPYEIPSDKIEVFTAPKALKVTLWKIKPPITIVSNYVTVTNATPHKRFGKRRGN